MNAEATRTVQVVKRRGWECVRLQPGRKKPATVTDPVTGKPVWLKSKDPDVIAGWFEAGYNVGICCGEQHGFAVIDVDDRVLMQEVVAALGPLSPAAVITGSGKTHHYIDWVPGLPADFKWAGKVVGQIQGVGRGDYMVVAAGSTHPDTGELYRWQPLGHGP